MLLVDWMKGCSLHSGITHIFLPHSVPRTTQVYNGRQKHSVLYNAYYKKKNLLYNSHVQKSNSTTVIA